MKIYFIVGLTILVFLADLLTKMWATEAIEVLGNSGIAFGIAIPSGVVVALNMVLIPLIGYVLYKTLDYRYFKACVGTALILGGALGNFVDRIGDGVVTDFIDLKFWPVFNMADMAVVAGVFVVLFYYDKMKRA